MGANVPGGVNERVEKRVEKASASRFCVCRVLSDRMFARAESLLPRTVTEDWKTSSEMLSQNTVPAETIDFCTNKLFDHQLL